MKKSEIEQLRELQKAIGEVFIACGVRGVDIPKNVGEKIDNALISPMGREEWEKTEI